MDHGDGVGGEELFVAADGGKAPSDVAGGVVGSERFDRQAVARACASGILRRGNDAEGAVRQMRDNEQPIGEKNNDTS